MINDDWAPPSEYHQIAMVGGWVCDIAPGDYRELLRYMQAGTGIWISNDIYGGEIAINIAHIAAVRQQTDSAAARYRIMHADDEDQQREW